MTTDYKNALFIAYIPNETIDKATSLIEKIVKNLIKHHGFIEQRFYSKIYKEVIWELESFLETNESLNKHIESFLEMIEANETNMHQLAKLCNFVVSCHYSRNYPAEGLFLSRETLLRLSKFPIDISFDLFE